ncbi:MAG: hypothetical protein HRU50_00090 [Winogradskyella sp.]|uniref:hypothetical protein n=1 Tax=Winogradskyella sp. TaxID=1883156 RepID=UPI0025FFEDE7|nr:hypothetical protein [Winogradskyella sp.]NRB58320.1 hypothetical protein [Winogradskyella sp.]
MTEKIKVYDAIMGSGKTYDAIIRMKKYLDNGEKFIYITPFKTEIKRVMDELNSSKVLTPVDIGEEGKYSFSYETNLVDENGLFDLNAKPKKEALNKRGQFLKMASNGESIISTHALFTSLKKTDFTLFSDYILILDEVINPLQTFTIGAQDIELIKKGDLIIVDDESSEVKFINDDYTDEAFKNVKYLCNNSTVYYLDKYFLVWVFPIEIFIEFKEIQILTYLFEGSLLSAYFKLHNLQYILISNECSTDLTRLKNLLSIYEGAANCYSSYNAFSKSWLKNSSKTKSRRISNSVSNIFKRNFKTTSEENAYTTFKDFKHKLAGKGFTKGFISINARASNDYAHKRSMAYLGNRYFDPQTRSFFAQKGIQLDEDLWALGELIQWIWRGCIRNKEEMNLFIPSRRMRGLLCDWLDGKYINRAEDLVQI